MKNRICIVLLWGIFLFALTSCEKNSASFTNNQAKSDSILFLTIQNQLSNDSILTQIVKTDIELINLSIEGVQTDSLILNELFSKFKEAKDRQSQYLAFSRRGVTNTKELFKLFDKKGQLTIAFAKKYSMFPKDKLLKSLTFNYEEKFLLLRSISKKSYKKCDDPCCRNYVAGMSDCTSNFAITTGFVLVEAAGVFMLGGNAIGSSFVVFSGIGAAYLNQKICENSAARSYRICMGYN
jgi:hypothetical protein